MHHKIVSSEAQILLEFLYSIGHIILPILSYAARISAG
jgi:hypothetical protein